MSVHRFPDWLEGERFDISFDPAAPRRWVVTIFDEQGAHKGYAPTIAHAARRAEAARQKSRISDLRSEGYDERKDKRRQRLQFVRTHLDNEDGEIARLIRPLYSPNTTLTDIERFVSKMRKELAS